MAFRILYYETVESTNDLALQFAKEGAAEGTVIAADFQTKGRGRQKREWISPRGKGLLFSVILRPALSASSAPILTHLAGEAVAEALKKEAGLACTLKKPNDVLVGGKKIAGILTESSGTGDRIDYVVIGIGLNVTTEKRHLLKTATSIWVEIGKKVAKEALLTQILSLFWAKYGKISSTQKRAIS